MGPLRLIQDSISVDLWENPLSDDNEDMDNMVVYTSTPCRVDSQESRPK